MTDFSATQSSAVRYHSELSLASVFASGIEVGGRQEIVTQNGLRMTYQDLNDRVHKLGKALHDLSVGQHTRVAVLERDSHRYLEAYFAVPMLGATLMTANIRLSVDQLRYTLDHSNTELIIAAAEFLPLLEQVYAQQERVPRIMVIGDAVATTLPVIGEYEALLGQAGLSFSFPYVSEDNVATHFYTTGTTGLPKGVTYTHRQLVTHTLALGMALGVADDYQALRRSDVYMPLTPMFHVHAWGLPYVATLLGLKQVYPGRYDAQQVLALVRHEGVTFSHCVPTVLQMILLEAEQQAVSLPGWKVMVGGATMSPALAKRAQTNGLHVFAGYGMSETCPVISFARTTETEALAHPEKVCRVGHPMPLTQLKIASLDGSELQAGERGELAARAVWLTPAYYRDPVMSAQLWRDDFLYTGDVAVKDEDGAFRIVDRTKDVIKSGGEWLSSLELETYLSEHVAVEEVAVIAVSHEKWGERPCAFITLKAAHRGCEELVAQLKDVLRARIKDGKLPPYAIPEQIRFVSALPRTSVGKLDKKLLREQVIRKEGE